MVTVAHAVISPCGSREKLFSQHKTISVYNIYLNWATWVYIELDICYYDCSTTSNGNIHSCYVRYFGIFAKNLKGLNDTVVGFCLKCLHLSWIVWPCNFKPAAALKLTFRSITVNIYHYKFHSKFPFLGFQTKVQTVTLNLSDHRIIGSCFCSIISLFFHIIPSWHVSQIITQGLSSWL